MSTSDEAVIVWGEVLWDRFPDGDQLGGAPANVAWHIGQAGGWSRLVTRVGADEDGRRAVSVLSEMVDTSLVQVDAERATGEVGVRLENGEARYTLHPGRAWERISCTDGVKTALAEAGVMVFGTLAQRTPEGLAEWRKAAAAASATCTRVCDLNLRPGDKQVAAIREAIEVADVLKVNDRELEALRMLLGWSDPLAELRARKQILAVTHGDAGSTLYGEGAAIEIPGVRATPGGDNVGCGDAYVAILVLGMTMGWDLETSGHAASRYAAAVASVRGATPRFTEEEIAELLGDVE
jgi:fructokinase